MKIKAHHRHPHDRPPPHLHRPRADHVAGVGKKARADRLATPPSPAEIAAETLRRARQLGAQRTLRQTQQRISTASARGTYSGAELRPFAGRPGAMDAFALPSRMGNRLHYRDGRVETLA